MTERRYFTRQDARLLIGRRVQARVAISRPALRNLGLWVTAGSQGRITELASGPGPHDSLVGIRPKARQRARRGELSHELSTEIVDKPAPSPSL